MKNATKAKGQQQINALPIGTSYEVPDAVSETTKFFRDMLKDQGCTELSPILETDQLAMLYFEKAGFLIALTAQRRKRKAPPALP